MSGEFIVGVLYGTVIGFAGIVFGWIFYDIYRGHKEFEKNELKEEILRDNRIFVREYCENNYEKKKVVP